MPATGTPRNSGRRPVGRAAFLFLSASLLATVVVFAMAMIVYAWPSEQWPPTRTTIIGSVEEFEPGSVTPLWDFKIGGYLVRLESGEFLAFDRAEPVIGCTLVWGQTRSLGFRDPCHGFEYDIIGEPSSDNRIRMPMNRFQVDVDRHDTIRVTTPAARR